MDDLSKLSNLDLAVRFLRDCRHTIYLLCDSVDVDCATEFINCVLKDYLTFYKSCKRKFCDEPVWPAPFPPESNIPSSHSSF